MHFVPHQKLSFAAETGNLFVQHVFQLHGIPKDIVSDRGPQFMSRVWSLDALVSLSSGDHPQSNSQTERVNQTLGNELRCMAARQPTTWSTYLPWVEYAPNSLGSSSSGISPFMAAFGYQPPLFNYQERETAVPSVQAHLCRCRRD